MTDRDVGAVRGASFWHDGESLMFRYVIDENNVVGPRPATEADAKAHPQAWAEFERAIAAAADPEPRAAPRKRTKA